MYNLYIKKDKSKLVSAVERTFQSESEFEKYIMDKKDIFSDIFILKRQVNAGKDIIDMVGIDKDNNIVIIENKNYAKR
jgi:RecB family endonuclease NucS